jgi:phosphoenolpyruvate carboxykinase (GTP)
MVPFAGYHMGDYFNHWLAFGRQLQNPPRIFAVNWFRRNDDGSFAWPGFGENVRVLEWIVKRAHGGAFALESPLGWMPRYEDLNWEGLDSFTEADFADCMSIDRSDWDTELLQHEELFIKLHDRLPNEMHAMKRVLASSLWRAPEHWEMNADLT